jgi:hypothetical protein
MGIVKRLALGSYGFRARVVRTAVCLLPVVFVVIVAAAVAFTTPGFGEKTPVASQDQEIARQSFQGNGIEEDPFQINSLSDLSKLRDLVNTGHSFRNIYFAQTGDIDFSTVNNWVPIGYIVNNVETRAFSGIYDGRGYTLSNLVVQTDYRQDQNGFFGLLDGVAKNIHIYSGEISGIYVGSIASHGTKNAIVVNCLNRATVTDRQSDTRAGGIVDDFSEGMILSCVNVGRVTGPYVGGICSYAGNISNCFSMSAPTSADFVGTIERSHVISTQSKQEIVEALNNEMYDDPRVNHLVTWQLEGNDIILSQSPRISFDFSPIKMERVTVVLILPLIVLLYALFAFFVGGRFRRFEFSQIFLFVMVIAMTSYWVVFITTNGAVASNYFIQDHHDTFMDFFNPIRKDLESTYGEPYYSSYPPLANLLFQLFRMFIPPELWTSVSDRGAVILRSEMPANLALIVFLVVSIILLFVWLTKFAQSTEYRGSKTLLAIIILLSGPFMFLFERGNNLGIVLILVAVFFSYYDKDNKRNKELALIALAFAVGLKLYPAVFAFLLLSQKDYRAFFRCVVYSLVVTFAPSMFYGGIDGAIAFVGNLFGTNGTPPYIGLGYSFSFSKLAEIIYTFRFVHAPPVFSPLLYLIPVGFCLFNYITADKTWKRLLALCMFIIWIPNSMHIYMLCIFVFPMIMFLSDKDKRSTFDWFYLLFFILVSCLYAFPSIGWINSYVEGRPLSYGMLIIHVALCGFAFTAAIEGMLAVYNRIRYIRIIGVEKVLL